MKNEFKVKKYKDATVYTLESATSGGTSAGSIASVSNAMGGVRRRGDNLIAQEEKKEAPKPRNFVAKNAKMGGAGQHKDKKKAEKQGDVKHKKPFMEDHEVSMASNELKSIHANARKLLALVQQYGERGDLEAWQQSKITKAADYLNAVLQSIGGEHDALGEVSLGDYRKKAGMQKAQSQMGAMFGKPEEREKNLATFQKRERGLNRVKARDEKARQANQEKQTADLVARLPELKAEYARMKDEYKSLGGSNWQYADREQNLSDAERKARSMEGPMNNLWRQIQAAEKAQGVAEGDEYFTHLENLLNEDWQKVNRRDKTDGMSRKAVKAYRRENPGSKLKTAVTTKPSKLKKGGKAAKRRKSFCARMSGNKGPMKKPNGKPTPKALALRRWNCEEDAYMNSLNAQVLEKLNPQAPVDTWVQDFQKADPNKYKQFKNKTPQKKAQMAAAAHYAANEPSKKK